MTPASATIPTQRRYTALLPPRRQDYNNKGEFFARSSMEVNEENERLEIIDQGLSINAQQQNGNTIVINVFHITVFFDAS